MGLYADVVSGRLLKAVRTAFVADQDALALFGAEGIRFASYEELEGPIRPPALFIVGGNQTMRGRAIGQEADLDFTINVLAFLPRLTPVDPSFTTPTAPSATSGAAGPLTGSYLYRVTGTGDYGESWASESSSVLTVTAKKGAVTIPTVTGATGRRLWRTKAGRIAFFYHSTIADNSTTAIVDETPDSRLGQEMAPIQLFGENLKDYLRTVLFGSETFPNELGVRQADAALLLSDMGDKIDARRNLRVIGFKAVIATHYNVGTGEVGEDVP